MTGEKSQEAIGELSRDEVNRVAADASVDPRTVRRLLATGHAIGAVKRAVCDALRKNGHGDIADKAERVATT